MKQYFNQASGMISQLAQPALNTALEATEHDDEQSSVLLGVPAAMLLLHDDPTLYPVLASGMKRLAMMAEEPGDLAQGSGQWGGLPGLVDTQGHHREVYWPLVLYLHLAAFDRRYETLGADFWGVCEDAMPRAVEPARWVEDYADTSPPPLQSAALLWSALCVLEQAVLSGRDVDVELVDAVVHTVVSRPGPGGALHPRGADAPETNSDSMTGDISLDAWTYRELVGLHALANLAVRRHNRSWAQRVEQVALYHLEHTQPDNTTNQPWGVFAFLWSPRTRSMGEQQLHDATAHGSGGDRGAVGLSAIAGMLLADAAAKVAALGGE